MTKEPSMTTAGTSRGTASRRSPSAGSPRRKATAGRTSAGKKGKPRRRKESGKAWHAPVWLHYVCAGIASAALVVGFYYFFIRPYAYRWKPCAGTKAYGVCLPSGYQVHGFDVSHHQGRIDWEELRKTRQTPFPIRFVFMKASEGGDFSDTAFVRNFDEARRNGFIRGAYHFYNPKTDAARQADFFIRSVRLEPGDLPPVLDVEKAGDDERKLRQGVSTWLRKIERHYRVKPILYTSYKFKKRYLSDSIFNTYPYWIAHYYVDSVRYKGQWRFWQHTDVGKLPGIREDVDLNVFNGTLEELQDITIQPEDTL